MKNIQYLVLVLIFQNSYSQEILNNQSVIDMIEINFEEQVIIDKIESSNSSFDTSIESLKSLKQSGVTPNVLSTMLKASKKYSSVTMENKKKASPPKPNETEFYWEDGKGELVKVNFMLNIGRGLTIDEFELAGFIQNIMYEAQFNLKVPSSFRPTSLLVRKRDKFDKYVTKNDDTPYVMQLIRSGTNAYGGIIDGAEIIGINPNLITLEKSDDDIIQEASARNFIFKKVYISGKSTKMNGKISIQKDFLMMEFDGVAVQPIPIVDRETFGTNHWKFEIVSMGMKGAYEYNGNETKYKNNGGVLTISAAGYDEQVIPLIKSD